MTNKDSRIEIEIAKKNKFILNIYYMLAYTTKDIKDIQFSDMHVKEERYKINKNYLEVLALFLKQQVSLQLKRGLNKNYVEQRESLATIRGKIDISNSIKQNTMIKSQLICIFDEFTENVKFNQIIKATFKKLLKLLDDTTHLALKKDIRNLLLYFNNVDDLLDIKRIDWKMRFDRTNQTYKIMMIISKLILENDIIPIDDSISNQYAIRPNFSNEKLENLFENFLLEFYKRKISVRNEIKVHSTQKQIKWGTDGENLDRLPKMQADIHISNKDKNEIYIIDAKFYTKILQKSRYDSKYTYSSDNLYQINTYVQNEKWNNKDDEVKVKGMLLYAQSYQSYDKDIKNDYVLMDNHILVRAIDLKKDIEHIKRDLINIFKDIKEK